MKSQVLRLSVAAISICHAAQGQVTGAARGFAYGVTGGGSATPVYPETNEELIEFLGSDDPQVIILTKTFDFVGTEGTTTEDGCAPWGTATECQLAIDANGWCGDRDPYTITYDNAAISPIYVKSNKSLVGQGSAGVINGKGLYLTGVSNVIIQNVHITNLNPKFVWGGDAFILYGSDLVWIDHCQISDIGRQHFVFGFSPNTRITLSNNFLDGQTAYSASCDGHHYWTMELVGTGDQITFQQNHVYYTSGRGPALSGTTLFHAVNSVWSEISGHAIEGGDNGRGLFEGSAFVNVTEIVGDAPENKLFSATAANRAQCEAYIGRTCLPNYIEDSGAFDEADTSFFGDFAGYNIAPASGVEEALANVPGNAGIGKI